MNDSTIIISRTDSIGDVVLTLPVAGILKSRFPGCRIIFLGRKYTQPVAGCCVHIDQFLDWDDISGQKGFLFPAADYFLHVFPQAKVAALARRSGIPVRVGTSHRWFHWLTCNRLLNFSRRNSDLHEAQLNFRLLAPLGIEGDFPLHEIQKYFGFTKVSPLPERFRAFPDPARKKVILHPGSRGSAREWGTGNFDKLVQLLPENKFQVFITGTKEEGERMRAFLSGNKRVTDMTGQLSLSELISFISQCDALVAASTGPLHLAAVLNKAAIGIYSPVRPIHPGRWAPIGSNASFLVSEKYCSRCAKGDGCNCMASVSPEKVAEKLFSVLK